MSLEMLFWLVVYGAVFFGPLILGSILFGPRHQSIWVELVDHIRDSSERCAPLAVK